MTKKIALLTAILLITSFSSAETVKLKSGYIHEGKIIEKTDKYIKLDMGIGVPITYYLDEIEAIDGKAISSTSQMPSVTFQPKIGVGSVKPNKTENTYINEEYGISITGPKGWYMERIEKTIFEREFKPVVDTTKKALNINDPKSVDIAQKRAMEMTYDDMGIPESQRKIFSEAIEKVKYLVTFHKGKKKDAVHTSIMITVQDISTEKNKKTILDYVEKDVNETKQLVNNFEIIEGPKKVMLDGIETVKLISEYNIMNNSVKNLSYGWIMRDNLYRIDAVSVPATDFEGDLKYFQEAINSLVLK